MRGRRVLEMRWAVGIIYMVTALVGLCWSVYLTLTGLYGLPFSWVYAALFIGSVVLAAGGICTWTAVRGWTLWMPVVGSAIVAAYFIAATFAVVGRYREEGVEDISMLLVRFVILALAVASVVLSLQRSAHAP